MAKYGGITLDKGDVFTVYLEGEVVTICVIGSYIEEWSGAEMFVLAVVNQDNMMHVPAEEMDRLFAIDRHSH